MASTEPASVQDLAAGLERVGYLLHALGVKETGELDKLAPEAIK